ncbi:glutamate carboxypeptidase [Succinivibrio dextrinosolvens DSM 3072]|uniref:Glutamate carboxypeptidase n=1 Tax=Succinivibrio dextrinosolvens DSM 3072 TaxID=1123324 RepID=A0A1T4VUV0_9GAMM|nr:M20 family metallopeptidase [Succinivibrio dextrinosolvens]SKA68699.1 glutamate carboxypeptidase [Succinivibrio dextrinosolvens DSM 3072]
MISNLKDYLDALEKVVNIDCGSTDTHGVTSVCRIFCDLFRNSGFHVEEVDLGDKVGHGMFTTNKPEADHYDLLLSGHLDTVFAKGTAKQRPFRIEGNMAYGPGVADMKNGCLAILYALCTLEKSVLNSLSVAVLFNPDEEIGSPFSTPWIDSYAKKSSYALVFESQEKLGLITERRKGISHIDIFMHGVGAHAGFCPEKGRSAINAMANCIFRINELATKDITVNFGTIQGGTIANAIAQDCQARVDVRFWTNEQWDEFFTKFKAEFEKPFGKDIKAEYKILVLNPPMIMVKGIDELKQIVTESAAKLGIKLTFQSSGGVSDGNHISQCNLPVLDSFGPLGGDCHTEREWLDVNSVNTTVEILKNILRNVHQRKNA